MEPYVQDRDFTLWNCDVLDGLAQIDDESVHCVVTSPPYLGLRDYGTGTWEGGDADCDHSVGGQVQDTKAPGAITTGQRPGVDASTCRKCGAHRVDQQLGLEATPELYVARMVEVFREVRRVLRADGTCWLNLGDSYAGAPVGSFNGGGFKDKSAETGGRDLSGVETSGRLDKLAGSGLKQKDLCGIPWRVAFALQGDGWYLRSDIIWSKPNVMPESVTDRPTKAHEYVFLLAKHPVYFYDADAIAEAAVERTDYGANVVRKRNSGGRTDGFTAVSGTVGNGQTRNARTVWPIATGSYKDAHFAVMAPELARRCILAGTSSHGVCSACGAPYERVVEKGEPELAANTWSPNGAAQYDDAEGGMSLCPLEEGSTLKHVVPRATVGWRATCKCEAAVAAAVVLDPFLGSGTTALVARKHGRRSIGIELSPEYCALAARRLQQQSLFADAP